MEAGAQANAKGPQVKPQPGQTYYEGTVNRITGYGPQFGPPAEARLDVRVTHSSAEQGQYLQSITLRGNAVNYCVVRSIVKKDDNIAWVTASNSPFWPITMCNRSSGKWYEGTGRPGVAM